MKMKIESKSPSGSVHYCYYYLKLSLVVYGGSRSGSLRYSRYLISQTFTFLICFIFVFAEDTLYYTPDEVHRGMSICRGIFPSVGYASFFVPSFCTDQGIRICSITPVRIAKNNDSCCNHG